MSKEASSGEAIAGEGTSGGAITGGGTSARAGERIITGGCHCGALRYRALLRPPVQALDCNCSICRMSGYLHINVRHADVEMAIAPGAMATYRFGSGTAAHHFCATCGVKPFYQPRSHPRHWAINARCVDGGIPDWLVFEVFDGTNWEKNVDKIR